ncbi:cyclin-dependent protein kinase inhibitor SMR10-like [Prosopis cineraria]|uniref:cyclin-dependent protein kinase inhibitor SMR10-like n=1 Tax=Prosopis cineraria TaxID=364024 RepID=UPI00240FD373|nr:cyclin-dependent protein kinase inhibitor SMR10-like [Prosopis cineraria]
MGVELEVLEEFWPITPVRTHAIARKGLSSQQNEEEDDCHTPTSPSRTLRTPLVCPPAPKKPRRVAAAVAVAPRNVVVASPSQMFFQVPHDLASVFLPASSKKIKASS